MRCNNLHIIFLLFFLTTLFGCGGCKNNGNEKPNINCNLSFNADSTQLITYYEVSDDYGIDYIIRTIYIGDSISSKIEYLKSKEKKKHINNYTFDISSLEKSTSIKIELQAFDYDNRDENNEHFYKSLSSNIFSMSKIIKKDFCILGYNTREISLLIFLTFFLICLIVPAFSLEENKKSFHISLKLLLLILPSSLGVVFCILNLNNLVIGVSNVMNYFAMIFALLASVLVTYLNNRYLIPKIKIT